MGYALTPLQHQILHQRGSLTRRPSTANTGLPLTRISKSPNILISMVAILYPFILAATCCTSLCFIV